MEQIEEGLIQEKVYSYDLLKEFVKVKCNNSVIPHIEKTTPRINFIVDSLLDNKLKFNIDAWDGTHKDVSYVHNQNKAKEIKKVLSEQNNLHTFFNEGYSNGFCFNDLYERKETIYKGFYLNVEVTVYENPQNEKSIIFVAHHDIVNSDSENANDNSASVCNLLSLAKEVKEQVERGKIYNENIYVVFTDCEECGGKGAVQLAQRIKSGIFGDVDCVINLELTALGKAVYCELIEENNSYNRLKTAYKDLGRKGEVFEFRTPPNDSWYIRKFGIDSINIGIITFDDIAEVNQRGYCSTWSVCHKESDKFINAVEQDMKEFVELLHKFLR